MLADIWNWIFSVIMKQIEIITLEKTCHAFNYLLLLQCDKAVGGCLKKETYNKLAYAIRFSQK